MHNAYAHCTVGRASAGREYAMLTFSCPALKYKFHSITFNLTSTRFSAYCEAKLDVFIHALSFCLMIRIVNLNTKV